MMIDLDTLCLEEYIDSQLMDVWQYDNANALALFIEACSFEEMIALGPVAERFIYEEEDV